MRVRNIQWKKRLRWTAFILFLITMMLTVFVTNRFYFSHKMFPYLSRFQSNSEVGGACPLIIGHRGVGLPSTDQNAKPENKFIGNTATAIQTAIDANPDWIEIDIRSTKDQQLVVFHDPDIDEKTTHKGKISELTLRELQLCEVLVAPREKILSLDEVFARFHSNQRRWILDIKEEGIGKQVVEWIKKKGLSKEQVILFGGYDVLLDCKDSGYTLGYTTLFKKNYRSVLFAPSKILDRCDTLNCELVVMPLTLVTPTFVTRASSKGIDVWSYDSDEPRDLYYSADTCGVKGVIVDDPAAARTLFGNHNE